MKVLSVNAGSSSLKFQMYEMPEEKVLISGVFERIACGSSFYTIKFNGEKIKTEVELSSHEDAVKILAQELINYKVVGSLDEIKGIGHRIVHGGAHYTKSVIATEEVVNDIEDLKALAPLHNPAHVIGIRAFKKIIPTATAVVVFDTAFHQTMSEEEYMYAVPYEWYTKYDVRKYGFHGTSHKYLSERVASITGKDNLKIITCHLGNGGSISAIKDGKCVSTSMGFTPNAGIVMGSRCGDIDVSLIPHVMDNTKENIHEIMNDLNKKSGLYGISGVGSDNRDVCAAMESGNERALLARHMLINSIVSYIARYYVLLNGADVIVFSAGLGENDIDLREKVMEKLTILGFEIDKEANNTRGEEKVITTANSKVLGFVIPTDEEVMIARDTYSFL